MERKREEKREEESLVVCRRYRRRFEIQPLSHNVVSLSRNFAGVGSVLDYVSIVRRIAYLAF